MAITHGELANRNAARLQPRLGHDIALSPQGHVHQHASSTIRQAFELLGLLGSCFEEVEAWA